MRNLFLIFMVMLASCAKVPEANLSEILLAPDRLAKDVERDARSRPDVIIPLLDLKRGDRVADIFGGGGYFSVLLAKVVGDKGEVLLQNNAAYKQFVAEELKSRFDGRTVPGLTLLDSEADDLKLGTGTLDAAMIIMSYHDLFYADEANGWAAIDANDFINQIYTALKPGGRFLIVDHAAEPGTGITSVQTLHRIDVEFAKSDITGRGFALIASSDALRNAEDDYSTNVFDPVIQGKTDRFVLVFEKPQ